MMHWLLLVTLTINDQPKIVQIPFNSLKACSLMGSRLLIENQKSVKVGLPTCINTYTGEVYGCNLWLVDENGDQNPVLCKQPKYKIKENTAL